MTSRILNFKFNTLKKTKSVKKALRSYWLILVLYLTTAPTTTAPTTAPTTAEPTTVQQVETTTAQQVETTTAGKVSSFQSDQLSKTEQL